jgi:hypothetical protein
LAAMLAALLTDNGLAPLKIGLFAPPRAGGAAFVKVVTSIPFCAYRYGNDPVTDVPLALPDFPYVQVPLVAVGTPCSIAAECHHIQNYVAAVHSRAMAEAES